MEFDFALEDRIEHPRGATAILLPHGHTWDQSTRPVVAVTPIMDEETQLRFTSTTAPGKSFNSRAELAAHYASDWHRYNLKRREAGLPLLGESDFQARYEAALALA